MNSMVPRVMVACITVTSFAVAAEPVRTVQSGHAFAPNTVIPVMSRGYLFPITESSPELEVYGPNGQLAFVKMMSGPGGLNAKLADAAADEHGNVAVAIVYATSDHVFPEREADVAGAIVVLDSNGTETNFIGTGRYLPSHLCFAADGAIWTRGWERNPNTKTEIKQDYFLIRRFSHGQETGAFVRRSSFPRGLSPGGAWGGRWGIRATDDRVGAWMYSGMTGDRLVWLELDTSGNEVGRWALPPGHTDGTAFTKAGLYGVTNTYDADRQTLSWRLNLFDKTTGEWHVVSEIKSTKDSPCTVCGMLMDADGDQLIFAQQYGSVLQWVKP